MSQAVGTNPYKAGSRTAVDGPWLDGSHGHTANTRWYCYGKLGDFIAPGAANTFVFVDEDHRSLNDGGFAVMGPPLAGKTWDNTTEQMIDWQAFFDRLEQYGYAVETTDSPAARKVQRYVRRLRDEQ